jgi:hypothetical protein
VGALLDQRDNRPRSRLREGKRRKGARYSRRFSPTVATDFPDYSCAGDLDQRTILRSDKVRIRSEVAHGTVIRDIGTAIGPNRMLVGRLNRRYVSSR